MLRRCFSAGLLFALLLIPSALPAADVPVDAFPDSTSLVIRLKNPQATTGKLVELADAIQPGFGQQVQFAAQGLGTLISNPTAEGVDKTADWWVAVFVRKEKDPAIVFAIPASDADAMKKAVGEAMTFIKHEKWGIYSEDADAIEQVKSRIGGEGKSIKTRVDEQSLKVLDKGDLSVFINISQLTETYSEQIQQMREQVAEALTELPQQQQAVPGIDLEQTLKTYRQIIEGLLQALDDAENCALALSVDKQGIVLDDLVTFTADTPTTKFFQKNPPSKLELLSSLPADQLAYFGLEINFKGLAAWSMGLARSMITGEEAGKKFDEATKALEQLDYGSYVGSFALGNLEEGLIRGVAITEVSDPKKVRDVTRKMIEAFSGVEVAGLKQEYDLKIDAEKYNSHSADVLTVTYEVDTEKNPLGGLQQQMMAALYGPDGLVTRTVYLKDRLVQTSGGGKEAMTQALKSLESPASRTNGNRATFTGMLEKLGEQHNFVLLLDLSRLVNQGLQLFAQSQAGAQLPIDTERLKDLETKPSFLGVSIKMEKTVLRSKLILPTEQLQGLTRLGLTLFSAQQRGQGEDF